MGQQGFAGYCEWLTGAPGVDCCVLSEGLASGSPAVRALLARAQAEQRLDGLLGQAGSRWNERQARLTIGQDPGSDQELLWAVIPVEADRQPPLRLQVGLLVARAQGGLAARLEAALAESLFRHGTTQPLTALTFLLENLLYAFLEAAPDLGYLGRKQADLEGQARRLFDLMVQGGVLTSQLQANR